MLIRKKNRKKILFFNLLFVLCCLLILLFLYLAPEETTSPLPHDEVHEPFFAIQDKKEAEKNCTKCHSEVGEIPLPSDHPPPYRCLFCHKRN